MSHDPAPEPLEHHLLVIDDERDILTALRRQFRRDYTVHLAGSAEEGLEIMKEHPIQVIISDQRMPGMKGAEFFAEVKHGYPDAMRLLFTGYADIKAVVEAVNEGDIFRYITKPWDPIDLDAIVRDAFERHDLIVKNKDLFDALQEANSSLERKVERRTSELRNLNKEKDRMIGIVAHDLRGPLGNIATCNKAISDEITDTEMKKELCRIIGEVTEKCLNLINDLLDVSAIATGDLVLQRKTVTIDQFLQKVIRLNRHVGEIKGIRLELVNNGPAEWNFDPERIEQVLDNLISTAFKFSHKGTTVTLEVLEEGGRLRFKIRDQGQGIREEDMVKLFGAFQKTQTLPTGKEGSSGLGLSICKRIAELHGGYLQAESVFGEGSTFSLLIPMPTD